jgi:hypothetical protein
MNIVNSLATEYPRIKVCKALKFEILKFSNAKVDGDEAERFMGSMGNRHL